MGISSSQLTFTTSFFRGVGGEKPPSSEDFSDHKNIAGSPWIATQIGADLKISEGFNGGSNKWKIHHEMWKIHHEMWKIQHQILVYVLENHQISWKILYQGIGVTPGRVRFG